jgi:hypothetical protein
MEEKLLRGGIGRSRELRGLQEMERKQQKSQQEWAGVREEQDLLEAGGRHTHESGNPGRVNERWPACVRGKGRWGLGWKRGEPCSHGRGRAGRGAGRRHTSRRVQVGPAGGPASKETGQAHGHNVGQRVSEGRAARPDVSI